jgi:multidrug resistance efflux pump
MRPLGDGGKYVVKNQSTGEFFSLGEPEHFLLLRLDGRQTVDGICTSFTEHFGRTLSPANLQQFVQLAHGRGLVQPIDATATLPPEAESANSTPGDAGRTTSDEENNTILESERKERPTIAPTAGTTVPQRPRPRRSLLYWRMSLFDPNRALTWLAPKLRFLWTAPFMIVSASCVLVALAIVFANWHGLVTSFVNAMRWETLVIVWLTLLLTTLCHEFAHGLTCKHYGGDVHEVGLLMLFFMPCFYCNVSDAWLFPEKSKRLWVTFAGAYCDLCLAAVAVIIWRLTVQNSLVNYLSWVVLTLLGTRLVFNFNPLLKLDGYYLLSDWAEITNLQEKASGSVLRILRWLLWGAPRPAGEPHGVFLAGYGLASWLFGMGFLSLMILTMMRFAGERWGLAGIVFTTLLGGVVVQGMFRGLLGGEVWQMILARHKRAVIWSAIAFSSAMVLVFGRMEERAGGAFRVHPVVRAELRAPVAGFLQEAKFGEGNRVSAGATVIRLDVPNLASRIAERHAEVREMEARLRLLKVGPRPEEVAAHRRRVERAQMWRDLAKRDLERARQSFASEIAQFDHQIEQYRAELSFADDTRKRSFRLLGLAAVGREQYEQTVKNTQVMRAQLDQVVARKSARQAVGTQEADMELTRRERELAEAQSALGLLEAGSRPEEIDAEQARLTRAKEDLRYLDELQAKAVLSTPVAGVMTTCRLAEKIGQYFREGELICTVEEPSVVEAEIALTDQEAGKVQVGQKVDLRVRDRLFESFETQVDRIASRAVTAEGQSTITIYCRLDNPHAQLRPGAVGYGRIHCGKQVIGWIVIERALGFLRTEFWW